MCGCTCDLCIGVSSLVLGLKTLSLLTSVMALTAESWAVPQPMPPWLENLPSARSRGPGWTGGPERQAAQEPLAVDLLGPRGLGSSWRKCGCFASPSFPVSSAVTPGSASSLPSAKLGGDVGWGGTGLLIENVGKVVTWSLVPPCDVALWECDLCLLLCGATRRRGQLGMDRCGGVCAGAQPRHPGWLVPLLRSYSCPDP